MSEDFLNDQSDLSRIANVLEEIKEELAEIKTAIKSKDSKKPSYRSDRSPREGGDRRRGSGDRSARGGDRRRGSGDRSARGGNRGRGSDRNQGR